MAVCLSCGKAAEACLCEECQQGMDIEDLCMRISNYTPKIIDNPNANPIWEKVASEMEQPFHFRTVAFAVADFLPSPRKEYRQILCIVGNGIRVPRSSKSWYSEVYNRIIQMEGLTHEEKLRLKGLMLETLYQDNNYPEADVLASELLEESKLPWQTIYAIAEFFSQTRRYDEADKAITIGKKEYVDHKDAARNISEIDDKNQKRRRASDAAHNEADEGPKMREYLPQTQEAKEKYIAFMKTLGIDVTVSSRQYVSGKKSSRYPVPIPRDEYPTPIEKREADFDSFVAYDFETTGRQSIDSIIEVGAVRVINGRIVEAETFREFVRPFKRVVTPEITQLTGITKEDVKGARQMWEVIPDFMKFVGDAILVGFNNIQFDSTFLCRAGRYSNEVYKNLQFDVLRYLKTHKDRLQYTGEDFKLETAGRFFGVDNPEAHRALADAITTARLYLKIKAISDSASTSAHSDSLLDLEEW